MHEEISIWISFHIVVFAFHVYSTRVPVYAIVSMQKYQWFGSVVRMFHHLKCFGRFLWLLLDVAINAAATAIIVGTAEQH